MVLAWDGLSQRPTVGETTLPLKTRIIMQLLISCMMAFLMSGIMGFISLGPQFVSHWLLAFVTAWPIAFIVSQGVGPIAVKIAFLLAPPTRG